MGQIIEYQAVGFAVSFAIASHYYDIFHDGGTLLVIVLTAIWLSVQIWSKIRLTDHELKKSIEPNTTQDSQKS